jgi:hypothetical protein
MNEEEQSSQVSNQINISNDFALLCFPHDQTKYFVNVDCSILAKGTRYFFGLRDETLLLSSLPLFPLPDEMSRSTTI